MAVWKRLHSVKVKDNLEAQDGGSFLVNLQCTLSNRLVNFAVVAACEISCHISVDYATRVVSGKLRFWLQN